MHIEILGVNLIGGESYNSLITPGRRLSWLQDTPEANAWNRWGVTYRDVWILDPQNRQYAIYNLTVHDLAVAANRENLKRLLLNAAKFYDADKDGLMDDWEILYLGNLDSGTADDPDHDGRPNAAEFAFGTDPGDPSSVGGFRIQRAGTPSAPAVLVTFRQRLGSALRYLVDGSQACAPWGSAPEAVHLVTPLHNLFDGTGTGEVTYRLEWTEPGRSQGFLKVVAESNLQP